MASKDSGSSIRGWCGALVSALGGGTEERTAAASSSTTPDATFGHPAAPSLDKAATPAVKDPWEEVERKRLPAGSETGAEAAAGSGVPPAVRFMKPTEAVSRKASRKFRRGRVPAARPADASGEEAAGTGVVADGFVTTVGDAELAAAFGNGLGSAASATVASDAGRGTGTASAPPTSLAFAQAGPPM